MQSADSNESPRSIGGFICATQDDYIKAEPWSESGSSSSPSSVSEGSVETESRSNSPTMSSPSEVVLLPGQTLPTHLLNLLKQWHRNNPGLEPLGSYRSRGPTTPMKMISRDGIELSETVITVVHPVKYSMLVLCDHGEKLKFVACVPSGRGKTVFKEWREGLSYEPRACAVRISLLADGSYEPLTKEMWEKWDTKMPVRFATRPTTVPSKRAFEITEDGEYTASERLTSVELEDNAQGRAQPGILTRSRLIPSIERAPASSLTPSPPRASLLLKPTDIRWKLRVARTTTTRYLHVDGSWTSQQLFRESLDFFRRYDKDVTDGVLECVVDGKGERRIIYNEKELEEFLKEQQQKGDRVLVEARLGY